MSPTHQHIIGGAISLVLGLVLLVWLIPVWVEPDPDLRLPVSLVPQVVAIGLALCGGALLIQGVLRKSTTEIAAPSGFAEGEFRGALGMLAVLLGATIGFQLLHFLIVAPVLVAVSMWIFGPVRPLSLILTSLVGPTLIWVLGTHVLGRVLP